MAAPSGEERTREIARFLAHYPPFEGMERAELERLAPGVVERQVGAGETVLVQNGAPGEYLYVVRHGTMELDHHGQVVDVVTRGQIFGHPTLATGHPPEFTVRAREDSVLYLIPRDTGLAILGSPSGVSFVAQTLRDRLVRTAQTLRGMPDIRGVLVTSLLRRGPVFCEPSTTIREAAQLMSDELETAILVTSSKGLGIVTDADLRKKVLAGGLSPDAPVASIMTTPVRTIRDDVLAPEAGIEMMQAGVNHLPVVDRDGRVTGVVSAASLMSLDALSPFAVRWSLAAARDEDELATVAERVPRLFVSLLDAHLDAAALTRVITLLNDAMTTRLLGFAFERYGEPPVSYAWLALGSSARSELTVASDQDNALAYDDTDDPEVDGYFARVAEVVNAGLERCGFSRDESGVLASDPHWRLSQSEWLAVFSRCLNVWDWRSLIRASIAFDFRQVAGDLAIVAPLSDLLRQAPRHGGFLSGLAGMASQIPSPLGFRQRLTGPVDIKKSGLLPVENLARFWAFARGISAATTTERLTAVGNSTSSPGQHPQALLEAYAGMSLVRLDQHAQLIEEGRTPHNVIDTATLRPLTRVSLQEALRVVAAAQKLLP